jgi:3-isopropylmalate/(R)-2-methylmalate dehydratase small subunit
MNITARVVRVPAANIDTDQIIPARFLKTTSREGLGKHLFADRPDFVRGDGAIEILVAGPNFGCGSSREHAVWALQDAGFRAVIAPSFADIFRQNALKNGLLPCAIDAEPTGQVTIDLAAQTVRWAGEVASFAIDPFVKRRLLTGEDELDYLLAKTKEIEAHERRGL